MLKKSVASILTTLIIGCGGGAVNLGDNTGGSHSGDIRINPVSPDGFEFSQDSGAREDKVVGTFKFTLSDLSTGGYIRDLSSSDMYFQERVFGSDTAYRREVEATLSSSIEISPIDVVYLIDTSYSVVQANADDELIAQANALANNINAQSDAGTFRSVRYRTFADNVSPLETSTSSMPFSNLAFEAQGGGTALYEALQIALMDLSSSAQPLLFLFTDGSENASSAGYTLELVKQTASTYGIPVFIAGLGSIDANVLRSLATDSGGQFFQANSVDDLSSVFSSVLNSIPVTYTAVYRPTQRTGHIEFQFVVDYENARDSFSDDFDVDVILGN